LKVFSADGDTPDPASPSTMEYVSP
jgi:hypothetical protein